LFQPRQPSSTTGGWMPLAVGYAWDESRWGSFAGNGGPTGGAAVLQDTDGVELGNQVSNDRRRQRRTPVDVDGRCLPGQAYLSPGCRHPCWLRVEETTDLTS